MGNDGSKHRRESSNSERNSERTTSSVPPTTPDSASLASSTGSSIEKPDAVKVPPGAEVIGNYLVENVIGKGSFAEVKLGRNIKTGDQVALKIIQKTNLVKGKRRVHLQREIRFLKLLAHPHIAVLYDVIEQDDFYVLIMEHASGGELLHYIRNADKHRLKEKEARRLFRQIVSAVYYCHLNSLIHRDIKPENILLDSNQNVKIIDFGFSREFTDEQTLDSFIGSPHYAAPELLQGIRYSGPEVDRWSLGILLYVMICGKQPFKHPDMKQLYAKITKGEYEVPDHLSPEAVDLISSLIQVNPTDRASLESVRNHKWLNIGYDAPPPTFVDPRQPITTISQPIFDQLMKYGFDSEEAKDKLLKNDTKSPIVNFYHLIREKQIRENGISDSEEPSEDEEKKESKDIRVTTVDTDETIPLAKAERRIRKEIFRRQTSQHYFDKQADKETVEQ